MERIRGEGNEVKREARVCKRGGEVCKRQEREVRRDNNAIIVEVEIGRDPACYCGNAAAAAQLFPSLKLVWHQRGHPFIREINTRLLKFDFSLCARAMKTTRTEQTLRTNLTHITPRIVRCAIGCAYVMRICLAPRGNFLKRLYPRTYMYHVLPF